MEGEVEKSSKPSSSSSFVDNSKDRFHGKKLKPSIRELLEEVCRDFENLESYASGTNDDNEKKQEVEAKAEDKCSVLSYDKASNNESSQKHLSNLNTKDIAITTLNSQDTICVNNSGTKSCEDSSVKTQPKLPQCKEDSVHKPIVLEEAIPLKEHFNSEKLTGLPDNLITNKNLSPSLAELADAEIVQTSDDSVSIIITNPRLIKVLTSMKSSGNTSQSLQLSSNVSNTSSNIDRVPESAAEITVEQSSTITQTIEQDFNSKNNTVNNSEIYNSDDIKNVNANNSVSETSLMNSSTSRSRGKVQNKPITDNNVSPKARRITGKMKAEWAKELEKSGHLECPMIGCLQTYVTVANFQTHYKWCTGKKDLKHCPYCDSLIFSSYSAALHHMEVEHPDEVEEYKTKFPESNKLELQDTSFFISENEDTDMYVEEISQKHVKYQKRKNISSKENRLLPKKIALKQKMKSMNETVIENIKEFKKCVRFDTIVQKINSVSEVAKTVESLEDATSMKIPKTHKKRLILTESTASETYFDDVDASFEEGKDLGEPLNTKAKLVLNMERYKRYNESLKLTRDWASERKTYSRPRNSDSFADTSSLIDLKSDSLQDTHQLNETMDSENLSLGNETEIISESSLLVEFPGVEIIEEKPQKCIFQGKKKNESISESFESIAAVESQSSRLPCYNPNSQTNSSTKSESSRKTPIKLCPIITYGKSIPKEFDPQLQVASVDFDSFVKSSTPIKMSPTKIDSDKIDEKTTLERSKNAPCVIKYSDKSKKNEEFKIVNISESNSELKESSLSIKEKGASTSTSENNFINRQRMNKISKTLLDKKHTKDKSNVKEKSKKCVTQKYAPNLYHKLSINKNERLKGNNKHNFKSFYKLKRYAVRKDSRNQTYNERKNFYKKCLFNINRYKQTSKITCKLNEKVPKLVFRNKFKNACASKISQEVATDVPHINFRGCIAQKDIKNEKKKKQVRNISNKKNLNTNLDSLCYNQNGQALKNANISSKRGESSEEKEKRTVDSVQKNCLASETLVKKANIKTNFDIGSSKENCSISSMLESQSTDPENSDISNSLPQKTKSEECVKTLNTDSCSDSVIREHETKYENSSLPVLPVLPKRGRGRPRKKKKEIKKTCSLKSTARSIDKNNSVSHISISSISNLTENSSKTIKKIKNTKKNVQLKNHCDNTSKLIPVRKSERVKKRKMLKDIYYSEVRKKTRIESFPKEIENIYPKENTKISTDPQSQSLEEIADINNESVFFDRKCSRKGRPKKCLRYVGNDSSKDSFKKINDIDLQESREYCDTNISESHVEKHLNTQKFSEPLTNNFSSVQSENLVLPLKKRQISETKEIKKNKKHGLPVDFSSDQICEKQLNDNLEGELNSCIAEQKSFETIKKSRPARSSASNAQKTMMKVLQESSRNSDSESEITDEDYMTETKKNEYKNQKEYKKKKRSYHTLPVADSLESLSAKYLIENKFEKLFPNLRPEKKAWQLLSDKEYSEYLPPWKTSISYKIGKMEQGVPNEWKKLECFDSEVSSEESNCIIFAGGPVCSAEWCPTPFPDCLQYIALSTNYGVEKISYACTDPLKGLIQLWNLGCLNKSTSDLKPTMKLAIAHNHSFILDMAWCPKGCWEDPTKISEEFVSRLGLLAVACSDSYIRIYSIPHPGLLQTDKKCPIFYTLPSVTLQPFSSPPGIVTQKSACCCLSWQKTDKSERIVGGYGNGMIYIWIVNTTATLNTSGQFPKTFTPYISFPAHGTPVSSVSFVPVSGSRWLASCSYDKTLKFWDLLDINLPFLIQKRGYSRDTSWAIHCIDIFNGFFNSSSSKGLNIFTEFGDDSYSVQNVHDTIPTLTQSSTSELLNVLAIADIKGSLFLNFALTSSSDCNTKPLFKAYQILKTDVVMMDKKATDSVISLEDIAENRVPNSSESFETADESVLSSTLPKIDDRNMQKNISLKQTTSIVQDHNQLLLANPKVDVTNDIANLVSDLLNKIDPVLNNTGTKNQFNNLPVIILPCYNSTKLLDQTTSISNLENSTIGSVISNDVTLCSVSISNANKSHENSDETNLNCSNNVYHNYQQKICHNNIDALKENMQSVISPEFENAIPTNFKTKNEENTSKEINNLISNMISIIEEENSTASSSIDACEEKLKDEVTNVLNNLCEVVSLSLDDLPDSNSTGSVETSCNFVQAENLKKDFSNEKVKRINKISNCVKEKNDENISAEYSSTLDFQTSKDLQSHFFTEDRNCAMEASEDQINNSHKSEKNIFSVKEAPVKYQQSSTDLDNLESNSFSEPMFCPHESINSSELMDTTRVYCTSEWHSSTNTNKNYVEMNEANTVDLSSTSTLSRLSSENLGNVSAETFASNNVLMQPDSLREILHHSSQISNSVDNVQCDNLNAVTNIVNSSQFPTSISPSKTVNESVPHCFQSEKNFKHVEDSTALTCTVNPYISSQSIKITPLDTCTDKSYAYPCKCCFSISSADMKEKSISTCPFRKSDFSDYGLIFRDADLTKRDNFALNLSSEDCLSLASHDLCAINTVAWNPNYGSHYWLFSAGPSGIAKLSCLSEINSQSKVSQIKKT